MRELLACLAARCGIDQPALSRLENGHTPNPTLDTLRRYAAAMGKRLVLTAEDVPETPGRGEWFRSGISASMTRRQRAERQAENYGASFSSCVLKSSQ